MCSPLTAVNMLAELYMVTKDYWGALEASVGGMGGRGMEEERGKGEKREGEVSSGEVNQVE